MQCSSWRKRMILGKLELDDVVMMTCDGVGANNLDSNGLLPTSLFARLFVSHANGYVIAKPQMKTAISREIAAEPPWPPDR